MAVVQISKIQVRRGRKLDTGDIPQLSSGEFAWAVDTQELFIGNGSLEEGAPEVNNTKILTEHDNILELAGAYQFAFGQPGVNYSESRSLQNKIDEIEVSILDFSENDSINDGSTSCNEIFEKAFLDLFTNPNSKFRKVLKIPNGEYLFTSDLRIPSTAIIRGETKEDVIFNIGSNNISFTTETGEVSGFNSANRPQNIYISNLTINRSSGRFVISGVKNSEFMDIIFRGSYETGDIVDIPVGTEEYEASLSARDPAVFWINADVDTATTGIRFKECSFENNLLSVGCQQLGLFESKIEFIDCVFFINNVSVFLYTDGSIGPFSARWLFSNCRFEEISREGFYSTLGINTIIKDTEFINCGNLADASSPVSSIVKFGETLNNRLIDCRSNRHQESAITTNLSTTFPEAEGASLVSLTDRHYSINFNPPIGPRQLAIFSTLNKFFYISYVLRIGTNHTRTGRLTMTVNEEKTNVALTDEYQYSAPLIDSTGGTLMTSFEFLANLDPSGNTVILSYKSAVDVGDITGSIAYTLSYSV